MITAAERNNIAAMKLCKDFDVCPADLRTALIVASELCKTDAVELLLSWGIQEFDSVLINAAVHRSVEMVKSCRKWGATDFEVLLKEARKRLCDKWRREGENEITGDHFIDFCKKMIYSS